MVVSSTAVSALTTSPEELYPDDNASGRLTEIQRGAWRSRGPSPARACEFLSRRASRSHRSFLFRLFFFFFFSLPRSAVPSPDKEHEAPGGVEGFPSNPPRGSLVFTRAPINLSKIRTVIPVPFSRAYEILSRASARSDISREACRIASRDKMSDLSLRKRKRERRIKGQAGLRTAGMETGEE